MHSVFAYSRPMQLTLAVVVFVVEFFSMYLLAGVISLLFEINATQKQKALFAFFAGTLLQNVWVYGMYMLGGMVSFGRLQYQLIACPNPIAALLGCYSAVKIFKLPPERSTKMMSYVYLFWFISRKFNGMLGELFFVQTTDQYNYLIDMVQQILMFIIFFTACHGIGHIIKRKKFNLRFVDSRFFDRRRELVFYFLRSVFVYLVSVALSMLMPAPFASSAFCFLMLTLIFTIMILTDMNAYNKQIIENNNIHISTLFNGMEEFRGIKHDFYNILQTYSGYLEIGDLEHLKEYHAALVDTTTHAGVAMELGQKIHQNPALVSLLISKAECAQEANVRFQFSLQCGLENTYIDNLDLCRILSCLLDNAIEAAASSAAKMIYFSAEVKNNISKIFIITNSTGKPVDVEGIFVHGATSKRGHSGIGLSTVRKVIGKYGNCAFHMEYHDYEVSTYLELRAKD